MFDDIFAAKDITRDRDQFLRELLRELASVLEDSVGLQEAEGFVALVGGRIGLLMNEEYRALSGGTALKVEQVAAALVDLKRRIQGGFSVESLTPEAIVLVNTACPFGRYVERRQSLCMMTSNVFGRIAASNLDYARVELQETFARGDGRCRVVVHLVEGDVGREYFD